MNKSADAMLIDGGVAGERLLNVLITHDAESDSIRILEMLRAVDCVGEVRTVCGDESVMDDLYQSRPDVVVLDVRVTHGQTTSLLGRLRSKHPQAVIVVFATYSMPQYKELCLSCGANFYLDQAEFETLPELLRSLCR